MLSSKIQELRRFVQPRFIDAEQEQQYEKEKLGRLLPMLIWSSRLYFFVVMLWFVVPRAGMSLNVWIFYRANNLFSALGYLLCTTCLQRWQKIWNCYDIVTSLWALHFLASNCLTRGQVERMLGDEIGIEIYDQGYQLLVCSAWIAGFFVYSEVNLWYFIAVLHCNVSVWMFLGAHLGFGIAVGLWVKLSMIYYVFCLIVSEHCRRAEQNRRERWLLQKRLEKQVDQERAVAQSEREGALARIYAAEQASVHSFMVAVFDIFGHLDWRTSTHDDEPKLCFEIERNMALDELLQRPVAGQPLDVLLGPQADLEMWRRNRQRLWEYAVLETATSTEMTDDAAVRVDAHAVARKIALTCVDANSNSFEIELFIRPGSAGRAIYGILVVNRPHATTDKASPIPSLEFKVEAMPTASSVSSSSVVTRSDISTGLKVGDEGEMSVWVDIASPGLPILKCSVGFTLLSGPLQNGARLIDMLVDGSEFVRWLQNNCNVFAASAQSQDHGHDEDSTCKACDIEPSCGVTIQQVGAARSVLEFTAQCHADFEKSTDGAEALDGIDDQVAPIYLVFTDVVHYRRKKGSRRRKPRVQETILAI